MFSYKKQARSLSMSDQAMFWQNKLAGKLSLLPAFADHPQPPFPSFIRSTESRRLGIELSDAVKTSSEQVGIPTFPFLLAAFVTLLARYARQEDIIVGSLSPDSKYEHGERFVNPLALHASVYGSMSGQELVEQLVSTIEEAATYRDYPFVDLVRALHIEQESGSAPIFQVMFVQRGEITGLAETALTPNDLAEAAEFTIRCHLFVVIAEQDSELEIGCEFDAEQWEHATIRRLLEDYSLLLEGIISHPTRSLAYLPLTLPAEQQQQALLLPSEYFQETCIHQLFEAQVQKTPDAIAAVSTNDRLTYAELNRRANQVAHYLRTLGVGPELLVGLCMERSLEMLIGLLGILKAGGAFLPLDPTYPPERLAYMVQDAGVSLVVTQQHLFYRLPTNATRNVCVDTNSSAIACEGEEDLPLSSQAHNLAYVLYTSGSTGYPKGVMIEHRSTVNFLYWAQELFSAADLQGVLAATSICFDLSIFELFAPLSWGGKVVLVQNVLNLFDLAVAEEVTLINTVPSAATELFRNVEASMLGSIRTVNLAGEPLPTALVKKVYERGSIQQLFNLYGPTEGTTYSTWAFIEKVEKPVVTIGRPIAQTEVYLLDEALRLVPNGAAGELYISGVGLARGYLYRAELTAERFIPHPFGTEPGARLYKTGDLARYLPDGNLEYLGRIDHQVKIRGFRIELGEIEALLTQHAAVYQSVVLAIELAPGDKRLVAYLVTNGGVPPTVSELRKYLQKQLPEYMVPAFFILIDELPLTPNGKLDRHRLPSPNRVTTLQRESSVPPRSLIEEMLITIWSEVLGVESIPIHADFFEAGGHSLLATQVVSRLRITLGVEIPQRSLFETPTIATLAERVETTLRHGKEHPLPALVAQEHSNGVPLSSMQQRLWFINQMEPHSSLYSIPAALRLTGPLHFAPLERSLDELIQRHEALRTVFSPGDLEPVQIVQPSQTFKMLLFDLSGLQEAEKKTVLRQLAREEATKPFDLTQELLVRATLLRLTEGEHILLLTMHHIAVDGWSIGIFYREVAALYEAFTTENASPLPELPIQYRDFALWQRRWLGETLLEPQLAYWKQQLGGDLPVVELPTDFPRPAQPTYRGARQYTYLPARLREDLKRLSKHEGCTLFMVLLAAFQVLLYRYTGQEDIVVGTDIAGRNVKEIEGLIGFFANQLVLRTDLSGNPSFSTLLTRVREVALGAYTHQDLPFEKLVEVLNPVRELSRAPLFQVKLVLQNAPQAPDHLGELRISPLDLESTLSRFDLLLAISELPDGLAATLEYSADLFGEETIARMWTHWQNILEAVVCDPTQPISTLPLSGAAELQLLTALSVGPHLKLLPHSLVQLFEEQAASVPDALAVINSDAGVSYAALNQRANQLARHLRSLGVRSERRVALCMERSPWMLVCLLAILKAGGVYVPLDPTYPRERLAFMLEDAQVSVLLTQKDSVSLFHVLNVQMVLLEQMQEEIAAYEADNLVEGVLPEMLAYIIYTSGSTGRPKGVQATHLGAASLIASLLCAYEAQRDWRFLQFVSPNFDVSIMDIFMALGMGSTLCLPPPDAMSSGQVVYAFLQTQAVTFARIPSSMLLHLPGTNLPDLATLITGGERWPITLLERWGKGRRLFNEYGATEGGLCATISLCREGDTRITIGKPLANTEIYLLDAHLQCVPPGVRGEVYIGGSGLARGYHERVTLTAERFIPHPYSNEAGARLYKTGDEARFLLDGELEFFGRIDEQLKIRGYRIELEEIEAVLNLSPNIQACAVSMREDTPGEKRLVAYIVPVYGRRLAENEIREHLRATLPDYMLPSLLVTLQELPLMPNQKVDRRALPEPSQVNILRSEKALTPQTPIEQAVAECWEEILGMDEAHIHDNFFDVGGHSLLATRLLSLIWNRFHIEIPVRTFFEDPTIAALAFQIERLLQQTQDWREPAIMPIARQDNHPLSFAQQRLWFINLLETDSVVYNIPVGISLKGTLLVQALTRSLHEIVARHETLRTTFSMVADQPVQRILPSSSLLLQLPLIDLTGVSKSKQEAEIQRLMTQENKQIFNLTHGPLLRAYLLCLQQREHILLLTTHHIASDGWSMDVFLSELSALYNAFVHGLPSPLPELPVQYVDYAAWQRKWVESERWQAHLDYWQGQLKGAPSVLTLPTDHPRPALQTFDGAHLPFTLSPILTEQLNALSRREKTTLFMVLLAAYQILLYRYTGQEDLIVGTPVANRNRSEIENLIGFFVNMLMMRARFTGEPHFLDVLKQTRDVVLDAYAHQDLPFEKLVEVLQPQRSLSYSPLFQVVFLFQNASSIQQRTLYGLAMENLFFESGTAKYDLTLQMWEEQDRLTGIIEYNTHLFEAVTIQRMLEHWQLLLEGLVTQPERPIREFLGHLEDLSKPQGFQISPGKIGAVGLGTPYTAPQTVLERMIAAIWQEVLRVETVGIHDNFFDLGGHSLLLVQIHSKLEKMVDQHITIVDLFKYPTVSALVAYLSREQAQSDYSVEMRRGRERQTSLKERRQAKQRRGRQA